MHRLTCLQRKFVGDPPVKRSVDKAIVNAKRTLIRDYLDHSLEETVGALPAGSSSR